MKTNLFNASIIYRDGDKTASITGYSNKPIKSKRLLNTSFQSFLGVDCAEAKGCHFSVYKKDNPGMNSDSEDRHIVSDETYCYTVIAFLNTLEDTLDNDVTLVTQLPKGLVMDRVKACTDNELYFFSGFNVMLLKEIPKLS